MTDREVYEAAWIKLQAELREAEARFEAGMAVLDAAAFPDAKLEGESTAAMALGLVSNAGTP